MVRKLKSGEYRLYSRKTDPRAKHIPLAREVHYFKPH